MNSPSELSKTQDFTNKFHFNFPIGTSIAITILLFVVLLLVIFTQEHHSILPLLFAIGLAYLMFNSFFFLTESKKRIVRQKTQEKDASTLILEVQFVN